MKSKKTPSCAVKRVRNIIPSREVIRDEIGSFIAQFLSGPERLERRLELRERLSSLKDLIRESEHTEDIVAELERAWGKFEALVDDALYEAQKGLRRARLLAVSCVLAMGAILLDKRWKAFFEALI